MNTRGMLCLAPLLLVSLAGAERDVPRGTQVTLLFDQNLSSKHARDGDQVRMHVGRDVVVDGVCVIRAGTPEEATIAAVHGRGKFGKNASIRLDLSPVRDVNGRMIALQPRSAGHSFKGSRTDHAAEVAGAGLVVLGPIGLVGGLFVTGKEVRIHPGDKLESEVSHDSRG